MKQALLTTVMARAEKERFTMNGNMDEQEETVKGTKSLFHLALEAQSKHCLISKMLPYSFLTISPSP